MGATDPILPVGRSVDKQSHIIVWFNPMITTIALSQLSAILILLCLLLFAAYPIIAQDATTPATTKKERVEQRKEARKDQVATREAALKEKLAKFKDQKKAQTAERINQNLNKINDRKTQNMSHHLDQMSQMLKRLETRITEAAKLGHDTSSATAALREAKGKVESAKAAVSTQAQKDYTITVTTESKIKDDAKTSRDALHTDLKAVHDQVTEARKAVSGAIRTTASTLQGVKNGK